MTPRVEPTFNITDFAKALGLSQCDGELFYGRRHGFPVAFKVIDPVGEPLLLFQVRHPVAKDAKELSAIAYDKEVQELIATKKLDVDFDDRLAWLSFVDGAKHILDGSVSRLLDSILVAFSAAGLARNAKPCHYCQRQEVEALSCIDGKVVQICPVCLAERIGAPENRPAEATEGALSIATLAPLAAGLGACGWGVFWIGCFLLVELLNTKTIVVPRLVALLALMCVAFATGGPVGYVIKRVRRRGQKLTVGFSVLCSLGAVILGEVGFVAWLIYREVEVFSLSAAWKILPEIELAMGGFHLFIKLGAAVAAIAIAVEMAKPKKPKLNL